MSTILSRGRLALVCRSMAWFLLFSAVFPVASASAWSPRVLSSTSEAITFSLDLAEPTWRQVSADENGEPVWDARVPGFVPMGSPGQVRLPRRGGMLVVPPGTMPRLEIIEESWLDLDGRQLAIQAIPVMVEDPQSGMVSEQPFLPGPGRTLPTNRVPASVLEDLRHPDIVPASGPAVRLGEVTWWRGRRVVRFTVIPVRADRDGRAFRALRTGRWRIRFVADAAATKDAPRSMLRRFNNRGDDRFAGNFINGNLLTTLPTEAAQRGLRAAAKSETARKGTPLGYPDVRLPVDRTRLFRARYSELVDYGLLPNGVAIDESQIRVFQRRYHADLDDPADDQARPYVEVDVPIHMVGEGDGFDGDDLFLLWGLRPGDDVAFTHHEDGTNYELGSAGDDQELFNENNIYWLQLADADPGESWARMETASLPPAAGDPEDSYQRIDRFNEALAYRENVPLISMDRYVYNYPKSSAAIAGLGFWSPVLGQSDAVIRAGVSNFSTSNRTVVFNLRDEQEELLAPLPSHVLPNNRLDHVYEAPLPASVLGESDVALYMTNNITSLGVFSYLDWVEVEYAAEYAAPYGRLQFPGGDPGVMLSNIEIPGFSGDSIGLVEVTDPRRPVFVLLDGNNLVADGDLTTLSLQIDQSGGQRRFYAASRMTTNGVADVAYALARVVDDIVPPTQLDDSNDGEADVLVVVHPEFREQVDAWVDYRRSRDPDLSIHVAEPQAIYDWYSGGLRSPWAIKRLVNHALESTWGTWAMLIVGDANENPREIGVRSEGRQWSRDWVPTHFHVQNAGFNLAPEVLGSDEWYAFPDANEENDADFPGGIAFDVASLYMGRIPCNTTTEFERVLSKIRLIESDDGQQPWRRRGIFISDDAWSSGSLNVAGDWLVYTGSEVAFEDSENDVIAQYWLNNAGMMTMQSDTVMLREYMESYYPPSGEIRLVDARANCAESGATPGLLTALSAGGMLAHFQGHANHWLLTHEQWLVDDRRTGYRTDIDLIDNAGRPWLFCGMGCHIGDYLQNVGTYDGSTEPGFGEKLLFWLENDRGSFASYASCGYEYLGNNRTLSEFFAYNLMIDPPTTTIDGSTVSTRWMLGELMWCSEADVLAASQGSTNRSMVYQYILLGDPLLQLDCGPPVVLADLLGIGLVDDDERIDLIALDATNVRTLNVRARDEAGISRLTVRDNHGLDMTADVVQATPFYEDGRRQIMDYVISLPVLPYEHDVHVDIYDAADQLDTDHHIGFVFRVAQDYEITFTETGERLYPDRYKFPIGEPVDLTLRINTSSWLAADIPILIESDSLEVTNVSAEAVDHSNAIATFTALATEPRVDRSIRIRIDQSVDHQFVEVPADLRASEILGLVNYPNPMTDSTRFVFKTGIPSGRGRILVWTVSGRTVAEIPFGILEDSGGKFVVPWNGRDREGDRLANGTYLYRAEIFSATVGGVSQSDMQRLVIMR